jgi:hypothetical protein
MDDEKKAASINLTDLENVLVLIDLATQRGALRANELAGVGALYEKIASFVKDSKAQLPATPAQDKE